MGFLERFPHKEKAAVGAAGLALCGVLIMRASGPDVRTTITPTPGRFLICSNVDADIKVRNTTGRKSDNAGDPNHNLGKTNSQELRPKDILREDPKPGDSWSKEVFLERDGFHPMTIVVTKAMAASEYVPPKTDPIYELAPNYGSPDFYSYLLKEKMAGVGLFLVGGFLLFPLGWAIKEEKAYLERIKQAVANAGDDPFVGKEISDYQLWEAVGKGGFGTVYRATAGRKGSEYALKIVPYDKVTPEVVQDCKKRFEREMKVLQTLKHESITKIIDYGQTPSYDWCVMPLYKDGSLTDAITNKKLTPLLTQTYARQMAEGLQACHDKDVLHRDFKPDNVMISDQRAIIIDFGIAKDKESEKLTKTGVGLGTVVYMAPEQAGGICFPSSDQYAYGTVLFEMLTETTAFKEFTQLNRTLTEKYMTDVRKMVTERLPDGATEMVEVLCKMMHDNPQERYPTMMEAYQAFEKAHKALIS